MKTRILEREYPLGTLYGQICCGSEPFINTNSFDIKVKRIDVDILAHAWYSERIPCLNGKVLNTKVIYLHQYSESSKTFTFFGCRTVLDGYLERGKFDCAFIGEKRRKLGTSDSNCGADVLYEFDCTLYVRPIDSLWGDIWGDIEREIGKEIQRLKQLREGLLEVV